MKPEQSSLPPVVVAHDPGAAPTVLVGLRATEPQQAAHAGRGGGLSERIGIPTFPTCVLHPV